MAAVTGHMEEGPIIGAADGVEGLSGLGAVRSEPRELASMHRSLTGSHWLRSVLGQYLQQVKVRHEWDDDELILRIVDGPHRDEDGPFIPRNVIPWSQMGENLHTAKVWSFKNSKMDCPSFDLPTGAGAVGGTCPGATEGQSIVPGRTGKLPDGSPVNIRNAICMSCITGDALIMVRGEGLKRIDSMLGRDFEVWSGKDWRKTRVKMMGLKPTVELQTTNGQTVRATADHQFLTLNGWVEAAKLTNEDQLPFQLPASSPFPEEACTNLRHTDEQYRTEKRGTLPTTWSYELGVFLGYIVGDGSFNDSVQYPTVSLGGAEADADDIRKLVSHVAAWTGSEAEVALVEKGDSSLRSGQAITATGRMACVAWRSKATSLILKSLGLKKEGANTRTPAGVWSASRAGVAGYLSGLFSTDGSVGVRGEYVELSFANTSVALVDEVQQLLLSFGIRSTRCEYKSNRERGFLPLWKLSIGSIESVRRFEEEVGFFCARKATLLREVLAATEHRKGRETSLTVAHVEETGKVEEVFDLLDVGPEAQFLVNGLVAHNCYGEVGPIAYANNVARQMLRHIWVAGMVRTAPDLFVDVMTESILAMPESIFSPHERLPAPGGILPIRIHSVGDFFSEEYAEAWVDIVNKVYASGPRGKRFRFWAPTRVWAARGSIATMWTRLHKKLRQPNLVVRPSAFHFDDPSPPPLAPGLGKGSTSLHMQDLASEKRRTDFRAQGKEKLYFDWRCPTYSAREGSMKSCSQSVGPVAGAHCRACWVKPDMSVDYPAH